MLYSVSKQICLASCVIVATIFYFIQFCSSVIHYLYVHVFIFFLGLSHLHGNPL